ncbi:FCD domain-containing protein [Mycobacterium genavense]|uniref:FCD domain-containing protein n=1 Tax=Mycobacterium genavense TaxID=36812 RepID=UPI0004B82E65|nr:FCD domain-containing protein [Mycobacterium genavense]
MVIYLEYLGVTLAELLNARLVLEPLATSLAAERHRRSRHRPAAGGVAGGTTVAPRSAGATRRVPHRAGGAVENPVLQLFIDVLMRLTTRYALRSRTDSAADAIEALDYMHNDHFDIAAAVTVGDAARAKTLSERHVEAVNVWLQEHQPRKGRTGRRRVPADGEVPRGKLAEVVAAAICDEIGSGGWEVGSVFGTETALLERYRVSRAVLREAVRLLEYHSVAQMRRGPGGGLVVTKPYAQASIDTIALYLQFRKPSREDLRCVRDAIEIDNVAKVVTRRAEPEVAAFLHAHRSALEGTPRAVDDARQATSEESRFHIGLAQLAGNGLLDLFLRIIVELFRRHWSSTGQEPPSRDDVVAVEHAHLRILDAIAAGDDSLAHYRIRRHLDAAASRWL